MLKFHALFGVLFFINILFLRLESIFSFIILLILLTVLNLPSILFFDFLFYNLENFFSKRKIKNCALYFHSVDITLFLIIVFYCFLHVAQKF